ncbi:uncharacterized protein C2845_PM14G19580 [Panicum miliaceum]|uniref:Uncharacterized protein n=1 Tax=Panicum miliaceum TaxID=4540 RepID=A0A3L6PRP3_PANMI|nr:uncharacterized protein C2845_PM14G19580 [Panicum miliaceum]
MLNVHAIDARGAADRPGCTECRCGLYNVTADASPRATSGTMSGTLGTVAAVAQRLHRAERLPKLQARKKSSKARDKKCQSGRRNTSRLDGAAGVSKARHKQPSSRLLRRSRRSTARATHPAPPPAHLSALQNWCVARDIFVSTM